MGKKVCTHYRKKGHIVDACYRKHGYPLSRGTGRGSAYANNVGSEFQEIDVELKMKVTYEGNRSLTQYKYNVMIAFLEKNGINGTNYVTYMVRGDSSNCYFAEVAALLVVSRVESIRDFKSLFESRLPKGPVPPSAPSQCHNKVSPFEDDKVSFPDDYYIDCP
ncbi:hypothetical protein KIW84_061201 [Lathyrus oleraceus]|uniref:Uncharacterized protein n=1 Tax=Pisum sativum TaxID=3888 RepID=A0A9D5A1Y6_PEA|nr:hypothetical protein KIW84_061201 [Pisum sativum]